MRQRFNNIDFLRGFSIIIIIIYHLNLKFDEMTVLQSGFLGVDIFFVISGYLIINIIYKNHSRFNFKKFFINFISKRLTRLLPAMVFTVIFTLFILFFIGSPSDLVLNSQKSLPSLLFISNIYYYFSSTDYFYNYQNDLFLHFWSLATEFQFYIIFSLILYFIFKLKKNYIHMFFLVTIIISFIIFIIFNEINSLFNFFLPFTRIWEFLLGGYIFYLNLNKKKIFKYIDSKFFISCFLILITTIYIYDKNYHIIYLPIVVVATAFLLLVKKEIFANNNIICLTGKISYSLYLIHFPIIGLFHLLGYYTQALIPALIIIIILSLISYELIEKRLRAFLLINKNYFAYVLVIFLVIFFSNKIIINSNGFYNNFNSQLQSAVRFNVKDLKINNKYCLNQKYNDYCQYSNNATSQEIILIGDSHINDLASIALANDNFFKNNNITIMTADTCYFLPDFNKVNKNNLKITACNETFQNDRISYIKSKKNPIVIMGGRLPMYIDGLEINLKKIESTINHNKLKNLYMDWNFKYLHNNPQFLMKKKFVDSLKKVKQTIDDVNGKLIIIYPVPEIYVDPFYFIKKDKLAIYNYDSKIFKQRSKLSFEILDEISGKNIIRVFPHKFLCMIDKCYSNPNLQNLYKDSNHLNKQGLLNIIDQIKVELHAN